MLIEFLVLLAACGLMAGGVLVSFAVTYGPPARSALTRSWHSLRSRSVVARLRTSPILVEH